MIADFAQWIARGFLQPRASMRILLEQEPGLREAMLMVTLGYLVSAISEVLIIGSAAMQDNSAIAHHVRGLLLQGLVFFVFAGITLLITNSVSGVANFAQTCVVIGWFTLVTSFLSPIFHLAFVNFRTAIESSQGSELPPDVNGAALIGVLAASGASLWLLSSYVAEANGFRSVGAVFWIVIALSFGAGLLMMVALGGAA